MEATSKGIHAPSQLTFHRFFHQNSAYGFCNNGIVGGMTQNPTVVTSDKVFHV